MAKAKLLEKSLVKEVRLAIGRDAPIEFVESTEQALSLLSKAGHKMNPWLRIGDVGLEHVYYQVRVAYALRALGHQAFIEKRVSESRRVDVLAIRDGRKMGIEVELHDFELADKLRDGTRRVVSRISNAFHLLAIRLAFGGNRANHHLQGRRDHRSG